MRFLIGDIGGTKTLLAIFNGLTLERQEKYVSHEYKGLEEIIESFQCGKVDGACFGIAGPIKDGVCRTTNLPWVIDANQIAKKFNINKVSLINDLQANAYGLKMLSPKDLYILNKGEVDPSGNQVLISAGTGLGESPLFFDGKDHIPLASEGGHCDFAPRDDLEIELLKYLQNKYGHVSFERVLSGLGLTNLYRFLVDLGHEKESDTVKELMKKEDPAKVISKLGLTSEDSACKRTLSWFCSLYAAEAGNMALKVFATGGVFLGGGIAPKIINAFNKEEFLFAFSNKGRFSDLLRRIPVQIVLEERTALLGSAFFCKKVSLSLKHS